MLSVPYFRPCSELQTREHPQAPAREWETRAEGKILQEMVWGECLLPVQLTRGTRTSGGSPRSCPPARPYASCQIPTQCQRKVTISRFRSRKSIQESFAVCLRSLLLFLTPTGFKRRRYDQPLLQCKSTQKLVRLALPASCQISTRFKRKVTDRRTIKEHPENFMFCLHPLVFLVRLLLDSKC
jgi:hypothetical protein